MKKTIIAAIVCMLGIASLFAQEQEDKEEAQTGVKYTTRITTVLTWPWGAQVGVTEVFKIPVLNFDNPLTRGNNITFKLGAELTPITLEGKFDIVWTPIAFLELYGGGGIGSGWSIKKLHGLSLNTFNVFGKTIKQPVNFTKAFYTAHVGGALQFDLGAIIPTDWTHIVFRIDQYFRYRALTGTNPYSSWTFQNDAGRNRNGLTYYGTYLLGYQMPLPLNLIALNVETAKKFFKVPANSRKSDWGEDRYNVAFGPIMSFKAHDVFTILLFAQWETSHVYISNDETLFYQKRLIDTSKMDKVIFKRVGVIFDIVIPHN